LRFAKQVFIATFWPLLNPLFAVPGGIIESAHEGYVGFFGAVLLLVCTISTQKKSEKKKVLTALSIGVWVGIGQMLNPIEYGLLQPSSLWQVRDPIVVLIVFGMAIVLMTRPRGDEKVRKQILPLLIVSGMCLNALFFASILMFHVSRESDFRYSYLKQVLEPTAKWQEMFSAAGISTGERVYSAHPLMFRNGDWFGYRKYTQLSSLGASSINSWPKIRSARTLVTENDGTGFKFLNIVDSTHGCKANEIQFLNVSHIIVRNDECKDDYDKAFSDLGYRRLLMQSPPEWSQRDEVWIYELLSFRSYFLGVGESIGLETCSLLSADGCLQKLKLVPSESRSNKPSFRICQSSCIATVSIPPLQKGQLLIIPIDFDSSLRVKVRESNLTLDTVSYGGFLGVELTQDTSLHQNLVVGVSPDGRMVLNALSPWVNLIFLLGMVAQTRLKTSQGPKSEHVIG
jgi:hypothetical protein